MDQPEKPSVSIFDGPHKMKKRAAIGVFAVLGALATIFPDWAIELALFILSTQGGNP